MRGCGYARLVLDYKCMTVMGILYAFTCTSILYSHCTYYIFQQLKSLMLHRPGPLFAVFKRKGGGDSTTDWGKGGGGNVEGCFACSWCSQGRCQGEELHQLDPLLFLFSNSCNCLNLTMCCSISDSNGLLAFVTTAHHRLTT